MLIRIDDQALVDDLRAHFRRSGFTAEGVGGGMVEVTKPDALDAVQERREISMHLRVWEIANTEANAQLLD
jgi:hypothetical protein